MTNKYQPWSADEIVNECLPKPVEDGSSDEDEVRNEPISPPSDYVDKLILFTAGLDLDPLILKVSNKINETIFYL